jgi:hypothetical protein
MPTEFASDGVDFEDLFDPDIVGNGPQATWLENNGVPLRYAALSYGTKRADVGYDDGGVDASNLWAQKGSAVYLPTIITASSLSSTGLARSASIQIHIKTNGTIVVVANGTKTTGAGTTNYAPTAAGASSAFDFRIRGRFLGIRNVSSSATATGKGGISYNAGLPPSGSAANFDSGWIATADDATAFLAISCSSPSNTGGSSIDIQAGTPMVVEVRRKSDGVIAFTSSTQVQCTSDSQS